MALRATKSDEDAWDGLLQPERGFSLARVAALKRRAG